MAIFELLYFAVPLAGLLGGALCYAAGVRESNRSMRVAGVVLMGLPALGLVAYAVIASFVGGGPD